MPNALAGLKVQCRTFGSKSYPWLDYDGRTEDWFWNPSGGEKRPTTHAIEALDGRQLVGRFCYMNSQRHVLDAAGTWVDPTYRTKGIARDLWRIALTLVKPRKVEVAVVSPGGLKLTTSLKDEFPKIKWLIKDAS